MRTGGTLRGVGERGSEGRVQREDWAEDKEPGKEEKQREPGGIRKPGEREPKGYEGEDSASRDWQQREGAIPILSPCQVCPLRPKSFVGWERGPRDGSLAGVEALGDNAPS